MTEQQKSELNAAFEDFRVSLTPRAANGDEWRMQNCERAIKRIFSILLIPTEPVQ
jgi:hypothetical protein